MRACECVVLLISRNPNAGGIDGNYKVYFFPALAFNPLRGKRIPRKHSSDQSAADGFQISEAAFIRERKNISLRCAPPDGGTWAKSATGTRGVK